MGIRCKTFWLLLISLLALSALPSLFASEKLTDTRKLANVYRMYEDYKQEFPEVEDVSPGEAMALVASSKVVFVDIRSSREQTVSMIRQAVTGKAFRRNP